MPTLKDWLPTLGICSLLLSGWELTPGRRESKDKLRWRSRNRNS